MRGRRRTPVRYYRLGCLKLRGSGGAFVDVEVGLPDGGGNLVGHGNDALVATLPLVAAALLPLERCPRVVSRTLLNRGRKYGVGVVDMAVVWLPARASGSTSSGGRSVGLGLRGPSGSCLSHSGPSCGPSSPHTPLHPGTSPELPRWPFAKSEKKPAYAFHNDTRRAHLIFHTWTLLPAG